MKKFHLPLTTAISAAILAAASIGCHRERDWQASTDTRVCVDKSGNRVADDRCQNSYYSGHTGISPFVWYYIARGGYIPWFNRPVSGGSYAPMGGSVGGYSSAPASAPAGAVTRGGFGGIGGGHAGAGE